jgi:hypothetical protein
MANAMITSAPTGDRFRAVQLLPAPVTVVALAVAAAHGLDGMPLAVIATIGALATLGSALLPTIRPACTRRVMPAPREEDRVLD